jgi:hypothetical protein
MTNDIQYIVSLCRWQFISRIHSGQQIPYMEINYNSLVDLPKNVT